MNLLLDTCSLIWSIQEPRRLSAVARGALRDSANAVLVSAVSFWEISLKHSLGKLAIRGASPSDFTRFALDQGWELLPLDAETAASFERLPRDPNHRDPFDRMLVWVSLRHGLTLVSRDRAMASYASIGLSICW